MFHYFVINFPFKQKHVTKIDFAYQADTFFPDLDQMEEWKVTEESEEQTYFDLEYTFVTYERKPE